MTSRPHITSDGDQVQREGAQVGALRERLATPDPSIPERPAEPLPAVTVEALAQAVRRSGWVCDDDEHRSARYDKRDCGCDKLAAVIRAALAQQSTPESRDE